MNKATCRTHCSTRSLHSGPLLLMLSTSESDRKLKILEMGGDCPDCLNLNSKSILGFMPLKKPKCFSIGLSTYCCFIKAAPRTPDRYICFLNVGLFPPARTEIIDFGNQASRQKLHIYFSTYSIFFSHFLLPILRISSGSFKAYTEQKFFLFASPSATAATITS